MFIHFLPEGLVWVRQKRGYSNEPNSFAWRGAVIKITEWRWYWKLIFEDGGRVLMPQSFGGGFGVGRRSGKERISNPIHSYSDEVYVYEARLLSDRKGEVHPTRNCIYWILAVWQTLRFFHRKKPSRSAYRIFMPTRGNLSRIYKFLASGKTLLFAPGDQVVHSNYCPGWLLKRVQRRATEGAGGFEG